MKSYLHRVAVAALLLILLPIVAFADIDRNGYRRAQTVTTGQVSCGTTATSIFSASSTRTGFAVINNSGATVYLGGSGVTTANGLQLLNGQALTDEGLHNFQGALYCRVASGTATITYMALGW